MQKNTLIITLFFVLGIFAVIISHVGNKTVKSNFITEKIRAFLPENWAFFTNDPRAKKIFFYKKDLSGRYVKSNIFPHSNTSNFWGLKRNMRAANIEFGYFNKSNFTPDRWHYFPGGRSILEFASSDSLEVIKIKNGFNQAQLCGDYLITSQEPLPLSMYGYKTQLDMQGNFIKIIFTCDE